MRRRDHDIPERRRYIRLDTVFPIHFRFLSLEGKESLSDELLGFTNNISKGGICLVINNPSPEALKFIKEKKVALYLNIELPLTGKLIPAEAIITWEKEVAAEASRCLVGLSYTRIDARQNSRLMRYARAKRLFAPILLSLIFILSLALAVNAIISVKLIKGNKALVEQLIKIVQESSIAKQKIKQITRQGQDLQLKIQALESRIDTVLAEKDALAKEASLKVASAEQRLNELNILVERLDKEKISLQEGLIALKQQESVITEELLRLDKKKSTLEKANLDKMYQWLKVHQNPRTGLVMSFEGDTEIANWAFIYDQALVIQAFTNFGDFERARKILDFFNGSAKRINGLFINAYYAHDAGPAEYAVHSGPNIWLGMASLKYAHKTGQDQYLLLAEEIAGEIIKLQNQDKEGGIRGGPQESWYSTEHNLDAYAFFKMLHQTTGKELYYQAAKRTLNWLLQHVYDRLGIPIKRGMGDSTIATDTYAWAIAAVGPEKLEELGMNPERIVEFAEENFSVEVIYERPEGKSVKIKGFDFSAQANTARGGVISAEWTAQMIVTYKIMADFYYKKGLSAKGHSYDVKADEYMANLSNMIISSPSPSGQGESCLPYATQEAVDTGHGWRTPRGKSTGSVSSTAYMLFAYYNYNPLEIKE